MSVINTSASTLNKAVNRAKPLASKPVPRAYDPDDKHKLYQYVAELFACPNNATLRLRSLADSPDAFAAEAARDDAAWSERLASGVRSERDHPVVAELQTNLIGLAWGRTNNSGDEGAHCSATMTFPQ